MNLKTKQVEEYNLTTYEEFQKFIETKRKPLLFRKVNIGECVEKWTVDYLEKTIGKTDVKIHVSPIGRMSFIKKNFTYKTLPFDEFIRRCSGTYEENKFILCENEVYYLRSIGFDKRGKDVADIRKQFPHISNDLIFPDVFKPEDFFSSVFRIASPGVQIWTHYDVMDNTLIQVSGIKKVILFSPTDVNCLYMKGDKSEILDVESPDLNKYPKFADVVHYECILYPGDVLFIPALWFHNIICQTFCIGVNVFWKNLSHDTYDKSDTYGNKDPVAASKALLQVNKAIENLKVLPDNYKEFYLLRCISTLKYELEQLRCK